MSNLRNRLKNAELLSLAGACIASAGLGSLLATYLGAVGLPLLVIGLAIHAGAMFYRRRLESSAGSPQTRWELVLYWSCWASLLLLAAYFVAIALN